MQQLFKSGFALKGDAANALRAELNKLDDDQPVKPDPQTFEAWVERWFAEYASRKRTPKTLERYRQLVAYALPDLGGVRLQASFLNAQISYPKGRALTTRHR